MNPINSMKNQSTATTHDNTHGARYQLAKIIRIVTIPPVMVGSVLLLLTLYRPDVISHLSQCLMAMLCLAVIPVLAYPLSYILPTLKAKGREGQRNLAFVLSALGYTGGVVYAQMAGVSNSLKVIFWTYFLSIILLSILNRWVKVRASGHACSIAGPIGLVCYFLPPVWIVVSLLMYVAIFWASVHMGRHTVKEFILGSITSPLALLVMAICSAVFW